MYYSNDNVQIGADRRNQMDGDGQGLRRDPHRRQQQARPPLRLRRHGPAHRQDGDEQEHDRRHGQVCDDLLRARPAGHRAGGVRTQAWRLGQRHLHPHRAAPLRSQSSRHEEA